MKLLILTLLPVALLTLGVARIAPAVSAPEEIERRVIDLDGDGEPDLVRVYEAPTDDPAFRERCLDIALSMPARRLTNCKALPASRGSTHAWHQYGFEPGKITLTQSQGTSDRTTETELYVWDAGRRDFRLTEVRKTVSTTGEDHGPAMACSYRAPHLPRYAYLSSIDREQLYIVLPSTRFAGRVCKQQ